MQVQTRVQIKTYEEMIQAYMIDFLGASHDAEKTSNLRQAFRIQLDLFDTFPSTLEAALAREVALKNHPLQGRFNIRGSFPELTVQQAQEIEGWLLYYHYANTADSSAFYSVMHNCFTADSFKVIQFPLAYYQDAQEMMFSYTISTPRPRR